MAKVAGKWKESFTSSPMLSARRILRAFRAGLFLESVSSLAAHLSVRNGGLSQSGKSVNFSRFDCFPLRRFQGFMSMKSLSALPPGSSAGRDRTYATR